MGFEEKTTHVWRIPAPNEEIWPNLKPSETPNEAPPAPAPEEEPVLVPDNA